MRRFGYPIGLVALFLSATATLIGCGGSEKKTTITRITIDSAPEQGASVLIEGSARGVTPLTLEDLRPGYVDIILQRDRYKNANERIEVKPGEDTTHTIILEPYVGYLSIDAKPVGAEVFINGESVGQVPIIQRALIVGNHTYELKLENHYPITEEIEIKRDYKYDKKHELRAMESTVAITSRPSGAAIYINNERQGQTTPATFTLNTGAYIIGVYTQGYVQEETRINLLPNRQETINLVMKEGNVPQGMILIPEGDFIWGADGRAPDETPRRIKNLPAYYIDKYEVTNSQFKEVFPDHTFPKGQEQFPASGVSWNQAMKFAQTIGKRLPTEAEWEKAARGPDGREYPWGDAFSAANCNAAPTGNEAPMRVGRFIDGASPYGVMDMSGNIAEWVFNWYEQYEGNRDVTKDYGQVFRVIRGGSFASKEFDVRCARRHFDRMDTSKPEYGFRCAKDVETGKK